VTHLGQRLSALIDGELEGSERERVLLHMAKCGACRDEVAALRMLKRRMGALGEAASGAGAGLTGRLIGLSALASVQETDAPPASRTDEASPDRQTDSPPEHPEAGQAGSATSASSEQRAGRYFLAGSLAVFLAGLGTAAFIAGGEPQPQAPTPPVTPSVDVMVFPHGRAGGPRVDRSVLAPSRLAPRSSPVSPQSASRGA
jgi:anti-sigma factor RsiW